LALLLQNSDQIMKVTDICEYNCQFGYVKCLKYSMLQAVELYRSDYDILLTSWPGGIGFDTNGETAANAVSLFTEHANIDNPKMVIYIGQDFGGCTTYPFTEITNNYMTSDEYLTNPSRPNFVRIDKSYIHGLQDYIFVKIFT